MDAMPQPTGRLSTLFTVMPTHLPSTLADKCLLSETREVKSDLHHLGPRVDKCSCCPTPGGQKSWGTIPAGGAFLNIYGPLSSSTCPDGSGEAVTE